VAAFPFPGESVTSAFIEWTQGTIRGGHNCLEFGAPYTFVVSVIRKGDEAYLYGLCMKDEKRFGKAEYKAIKQVLILGGIKKVTWERKNNESREVSVYI
jgi:hypothetical protein